MEFSQQIKDFLKETYPGKDIYNMSLDELKMFKNEVTDKKHEYSLLELAVKTCMNAAYGSAANQWFYFFNNKVAADITGECRNLTKTMWSNLENFFHETIWERKDLWKQFDFELDESKHDWFRSQNIAVYSDTDSCYTTYGNFFDCMTSEYQEKYKSPKAKVDWILKFNKEFLDKQNNQWCDDIYNPRHGKSCHVFELETISQSCIYQKKKKYIKALLYSKGKFYDTPKISGAGIELVKSTSPEFCRKIIKDLTTMLLFDYNDNIRNEFMTEFNIKLQKYRKEFYKAPIEDISQSVNIGNYTKFVIDDTDQLILAKGCPVSVQAIARYNHLAHKHHQDNKRTLSGKIKYYNIALDMNGRKIGYFGYPSGELPEWAPEMCKIVQWEKNVIDPINRFLEVMHIDLVGPDESRQLSFF